MVDGDGGVWVWGWGIDGRLGHGDRANVRKPKQVEALRGVRIVQVSCGDHHTLALDDAGVVYAWGWGKHGILGHGDEENARLPKRIEALKGIRCVSIEAGWSHSAVLTDDGKVYTWGWDLNGQLGLAEKDAVVASGTATATAATASNENVPRLVEALEGKRVIQIACGSYHTVALTDAAELYTWGWGKNGRLGHGDQVSQSRPKIVDALVGKRICHVACGDSTVAALTDSGQLFTWGQGDQGQLGHGAPESLSVPTPVAALAGKAVHSVVAGGAFMAVLVGDKSHLLEMMRRIRGTPSKPAVKKDALAVPVPSATAAPAASAASAAPVAAPAAPAAVSPSPRKLDFAPAAAASSSSPSSATTDKLYARLVATEKKLAETMRERDEAYDQVRRDRATYEKHLQALETQLESRAAASPVRPGSNTDADVLSLRTMLRKAEEDGERHRAEAGEEIVRLGKALSEARAETQEVRTELDRTRAQKSILEGELRDAAKTSSFEPDMRTLDAANAVLLAKVADLAKLVERITDVHVGPERDADGDAETVADNDPLLIELVGERMRGIASHDQNALFLLASVRQTLEEADLRALEQQASPQRTSPPIGNAELERRLRETELELYRLRAELHSHGLEDKTQTPGRRVRLHPNLSSDQWLDSTNLEFPPPQEMLARIRDDAHQIRVMQGELAQLRGQHLMSASPAASPRAARTPQSPGGEQQAHRIAELEETVAMLEQLHAKAAQGEKEAIEWINRHMNAKHGAAGAAGAASPAPALSASPVVATSVAPVDGESAQMRSMRMELEQTERELNAVRHDRARLERELSTDGGVAASGDEESGDGNRTDTSIVTGTDGRPLDPVSPVPPSPEVSRELYEDEDEAVVRRLDELTAGDEGDEQPLDDSGVYSDFALRGRVTTLKVALQDLRDEKTRIKEISREHIRKLESELRHVIRQRQVAGSDLVDARDEAKAARKEVAKLHDALQASRQMLEARVVDGDAALGHAHAQLAMNAHDIERLHGELASARRHLSELARDRADAVEDAARDRAAAAALERQKAIILERANEAVAAITRKLHQAGFIDVTDPHRLIDLSGIEDPQIEWGASVRLDRLMRTAPSPGPSQTLGRFAEQPVRSRGELERQLDDVRRVMERELEGAKYDAVRNDMNLRALDDENEEIVTIQELRERVRASELARGLAEEEVSHLRRRQNLAPAALAVIDTPELAAVKSYADKLHAALSAAKKDISELEHDKEVLAKRAKRAEALLDVDARTLARDRDQVMETAQILLRRVRDEQDQLESDLKALFHEVNVHGDELSRMLNVMATVVDETEKSQQDALQQLRGLADVRDRSSDGREIVASGLHAIDDEARRPDVSIRSLTWPSRPSSGARPRSLCWPPRSPP